MTTEIQFEDEAAIIITRKKRFGLVFVLLTLIPAILLAFNTIWTHHIGLDSMAFTELITNFSPLTHWDIYFVYIIMSSCLFLPFIVYRSYNRMDTSLSKLAHVFTQCMHGIVCKGIH